MAEMDPQVKSFYETIALNVQSGASYAIKFKNDPTIYIGIPVMDLMAKEDGIFSFRILEPRDKRATVSRSVGLIELMKAA